MNPDDSQPLEHPATARRLIIDLVESSPPQGSIHDGTHDGTHDGMHDGTSAELHFSGWMELLAVIESLLP